MSPFAEHVKKLQRFAGVKVDGMFGTLTAAALVAKLGLDGEPANRPLPTAHAKLVCLDPGHGMGNKKPGVFDTGCVRGSHQESELAWRWMLAIRAELSKRGVAVISTRDLYDEPCGLNSRAAFAKANAATHFLSIHVNDADARATGTETLIAAPHSKPFAQGVHNALIAGLGLRDRGIKFRDDLAVLKTGSIPSALIELGFIESDWGIISSPVNIVATAALIAESISNA